MASGALHHRSTGVEVTVERTGELRDRRAWSLVTIDMLQLYTKILVDYRVTMYRSLHQYYTQAIHHLATTLHFPIRTST